MSEHKLKNFFESSLFLFGAFVLTLFLLFIYARSYYQDYQVRKEIGSMQEEVKRLEAKKLESLEMLQYVKTPAFLEVKARTEFNLIKPGEKVAIIDSSLPKKDNGQTEEKVVESENMPVVLRWWQLFFKN